jgi:RNA polymerase-binding transcription factor DksA
MVRKLEPDRHEKLYALFIEKGRYPACAACGRLIEIDRLRRKPFELHCAFCAPAVGKRPM